jgi:hypothetical protein
MLTPQQLLTLRTYVTPVPWSRHQELPGNVQIDPKAAYSVYGDLRLVAADVLDAAAADARAEAITAAVQAVSAVEVGPIKLKLGSTQGQGMALEAMAGRWEALAARLRTAALTEARRRSVGSMSLEVVASF